MLGIVFQFMTMPQLTNRKRQAWSRRNKKLWDRRVFGLKKKKKTRRRFAESSLNRKAQDAEYLAKTFGKHASFESIIEKLMPTNLLYILNCGKGDLGLNRLRSSKTFRQRTPEVKVRHLYVPETFSLIDNPVDSYDFLRNSVLSLLFGNYKKVYFSYKNCKTLGLGAQVVLDIIKKEARLFIDKCKRYKMLHKIGSASTVGLSDLNRTNEEVYKILQSVGSLAVQANLKSRFEDIIPYQLCTHSRDQDRNSVKAIQQKDIDTTELADYVIDSLGRMNKELTSKKLENLCTIIGETLINAEEHATTNHRFSIGYFQEKHNDDAHYGAFHLVIMNFGNTIYEKFANADSPNVEIVKQMRSLSSKYTKKRFFRGKQFEEENLWTLYALQEGVTSIPDSDRGNGSIQFINSFFSIKGEGQVDGEKSRMTILSGNTRILFDGTYRIMENTRGEQNFKVMTFNTSGNIEDTPDSKFVSYVTNYFPGTLISAQIFLNDDDFIDAE